MKQLNDFVASKLLRMKAIKLQPHNPFLWATGWNSPIYCDNRKILSYPQVRNVIKVELARIVAEEYPDVDVIAAVATNAIAMGVLLAQELGLPFIYVHSSPKDHGFENMIEGDLRPRQNVLVVEDQVSVGKNSMKVVETIRKNACKVVGMLAIFDYQLSATRQQFKKEEINLTALTNFEAVIRHALEEGYIREEDAEILQTWQKNPEKWSMDNK